MWLGRTSGAGAEIDDSSTGRSACSRPYPLSGAWPSQNLSVAPAKAHIDQGGGIQDCTEPSSHRSSYHSPSGNVHLGAPQAGRTEAQHHLEMGEVMRQRSSWQTELERQQRPAGESREVSGNQWTPCVANPVQSVQLQGERCSWPGQKASQRPPPTLQTERRRACPAPSQRGR